MPIFLSAPLNLLCPVLTLQWSNHPPEWSTSVTSSTHSCLRLPEQNQKHVLQKGSNLTLICPLLSLVISIHSPQPLLSPLRLCFAVSPDFVTVSCHRGLPTPGDSPTPGALSPGSVFPCVLLTTLPHTPLLQLPWTSHPLPLKHNEHFQGPRLTTGSSLHLEACSPHWFNFSRSTGNSCNTLRKLKAHFKIKLPQILLYLLFSRTAKLLQRAAYACLHLLTLILSNMVAAPSCHKWLPNCKSQRTSSSAHSLCPDRPITFLFSNICFPFTSGIPPHPPVSRPTSLAAPQFEFLGPLLIHPLSP